MPRTTSTPELSMKIAAHLWNANGESSGFVAFKK
jgi:hypothetical protein